MKEIGLKLKNKREENGVSIEEAAEDLKMRPSQIVSLENGDKDAFKDVLSLKYFIRDYAKYLGLDGEKMIDEFNEFLFDFTSKIPIEDIENAKEKQANKKEIVSPYTNSNGDTNKLKLIVISIVGILLLLIIMYFVMSEISKNDFKDDNITYIIRR